MSNVQVRGNDHAKFGIEHLRVPFSLYVQGMAKGDHIKVFRGLYWHHGIETEDGTVIHQTGEPGRSLNAAIRETRIEDFLRKGKMRTVCYECGRDAEDVLERARSRIGSTGYGLLFNNCEHFARWCRTGRTVSRQVDSVAWTGVALGATARIAASILGRSATRSAALHGLRFLGPVGTSVALAAGAVAFVSRKRRENGPTFD